MHAAVFVDFENLFLSLKHRSELSGLRPRDLSLTILEALKQRLQAQHSPMVMGRSYAAFDAYPGMEVAHDLALMGFDPQYVLVGHAGSGLQGQAGHLAEGCGLGEQVGGADLAHHDHVERDPQLPPNGLADPLAASQGSAATSVRGSNLLSKSAPGAPPHLFPHSPYFRLARKPRSRRENGAVSDDALKVGT